MTNARTKPPAKLTGRTVTNAPGANAREANDPLKYETDRQIRLGGVACVVGLGGFLLWGALAPLEEGVAATGQIVVEDQRKVVQHLEGGIVEAVLVRDGERVNAGDVLVVLRETVSLAARDQVAQEYAANRAALTRLDDLAALAADAAAADRSVDEPLDFAALEGLALGATEKADIIERETRLHRQQRDAYVADLDVLKARRAAAASTREQRGAQIKIARRAHKAAEDELAAVRVRYAEQLARRDQVTSAEQRAASLEGEVARLESERDGADADARDLAAQIRQARARFAEEIASQTAAVRAELQTAEERLSAAQDVLDRAVIRAPVDGEVLNLAFATIGAVVRPGETIMEIIPDSVDAVASVRVRPADRASVFEGQTVRTQISAYRGWSAPRLAGAVLNVSADLKTDAATSAQYYEARILLADGEVAKLGEFDVVPGMPVNAFIYSGRKRTMFDYLLEPLSESLYRGLRAL